MCSYEKPRDAGVSPVVGVMLMLVVTIIIAAVVSAYSGGLAKTSDKAPTLVMDVTIKNSGVWSSSYILFDVKSVSEPILTKDLKIITLWTSSDGKKGGNSTMAGLNFPNTRTNLSSSGWYHSPLGYGPGVTNWATSGTFPPEQQYGNYTLTAGTIMKNSAYGYNLAYGGYGVETPYTYTTGTSYGTSGIDGMQSILGGNWNNLRTGNTVNIMILHMPSGKTIFNKNVQVVG